MEISVREAASLLGRSRRTVRAQLARGEIAGRKRGGHWRIDRRHLPLTADQHRALQKRAERVRGAVEAALPSRSATHRADRSRSLVDLEAFRLGAAVLHDLRQHPQALPEAEHARIASVLERSLLDLAESSLQFDRDAKRQALHRCRAKLAEAVGLLALVSSVTPNASANGWMQRLEKEMLPALAGFARWVDRLRERTP